jgi:Family of unknown function (DUF6412)
VNTVRALCLVLAGIAASWQLTSHAHLSPSALMAMGAVAVAGAIIGLVARSGWLGRTLTAGPLRRRAAALRRKSWGAAFQRQRDPDAAGHARPRAPSAAPAAA